MNFLWKHKCPINAFKCLETQFLMSLSGSKAFKMLSTDLLAALQYRSDVEKEM